MAIAERPTLFDIKEPGNYVREGNLANIDDVKEALLIMRSGGLVSVQMRGVYGIFVRGDNRDATRAALKVKNPSDNLCNKPFSSMMLSQDFFPLIDRDRLSPEFQELLEDAHRFQRELGALCHIRVPVKPELVAEHDIPLSMLSFQDGRPYMQNLDPFGHGPMTRFIRMANEVGMKTVAITTLNNSHVEAEITKAARAKEFCGERQIPLLLHDPYAASDDVQGSFAIIDCEKGTAERDGHVPIKLIEYNFGGIKLDKTSMKPAHYDHSNFPDLVSSPDLSPELRRAAILLHFKGFTPDRIKHRIDQTKTTIKTSTK